MNKKKTVKIGFSESKNKQKLLVEDMVVANGNQHVIIDIPCSKTRVWTDFGLGLGLEQI